MEAQVLDLPFAEIEVDLGSHYQYMYLHKYDKADVRVVRYANSMMIVQRVSGYGAIGEPLWIEVSDPWELVAIFRIAVMKIAEGRTFRAVSE